MRGPGVGIVCVSSAQQFVLLKNEVAVIETMGDDLIPYKLWAADLLECPESGIKIIAGFGQNPISHCHEPDFKQLVAKYFDLMPVFYVSGKRGRTRCFSSDDARQLSALTFDDLDWSYDETNGVSSYNC